MIKELMFLDYKFCHYTISEYESNRDPDINFFDKSEFSISNYYDLANINKCSKLIQYNIPFNILQCNCRSLFNKIKDLETLAKLIKLKIIALT